MESINELKIKIERIEEQCIEAYEQYLALKQELEELNRLVYKQERLISLGLENHLNLDMPIETLELSVRSYNALKRAFIINVEDIYVWGEKLFKIRNLGIKSAREIMETLQDLGFDISCFKFEEFYGEKL